MATSAFTLFGELKADTRDFQRGMAAADASLTKFASQMDRTESRVSASLRAIGDGMATIGRGLTATVTAPLVALGAASAKSALDFDTLRTQLTAATGDTSSAAAKFKELNKLAQDNAGVFTSSAAATYSFLKPLNITEGTINEVIKAFGKLKATNPNANLDQMAANLGNLFDQGFEMQDVKELFGAFPRAGEILQKAFSLSGSDRGTVAEEMRKIAEAGLTREDFFAKFAQGINTDAFLSKVTDSMSVGFQKSMEQIKLSLEPLGLIIVNALARATPYIVSFVQMVSAAFQQLSPTIQTVIVAFGAIAAAVGPIVIGIGHFVSALGTLGVSAPALSTIALVIAGIGAALAPIIVTAAFFSQEWLRNWELVKQVFWAGFEAVTGVVTSLVGTIQALWADHGAAVMGYLSAWWTTLSEFISAWFGVIGDVLNVALQVIQGNWQAAWEGVLKLTENVWAMIAQLVTNALSVTWKLLQAWAPILADVFVQLGTKILQVVGQALAYVVYFIATLPQQIVALVPKLISAGMQIGSAIWQGIQKGFMSGGGGSGAIDNPAGPMNAFTGLIDQFKNAFGGTGSMAFAGGSVFTPTVTGLDTVKTKLQDVGKAAKQAAAPIRQVMNAGQAAASAKSAVKAQPGINATIKGLLGSDGKPYDLKIRSFDKFLGTHDGMISELMAIGSAAKKGQMYQPALPAASGNSQVEITSRLIDALLDVSDAARSGSIVKIVNEAPDNARVIRAPRAADVNRKYGGR